MQNNFSCIFVLNGKICEAGIFSTFLFLKCCIEVMSSTRCIYRLCNPFFENLFNI